MKLPIKLLLVLATNNGLTYKEISERTSYHINTISRQVSVLFSKGLINLTQEKSNSIRGKKWVHVVELKEEFQNITIAAFMQKLSNQLKCPLNDLFVNQLK